MDERMKLKEFQGLISTCWMCKRWGCSLGSDSVRYIYRPSDEVVLFSWRSGVEEGPQCTSCVSNHCSHCRETTNREFNMHAYEHTHTHKHTLSVGM